MAVNTLKKLQQAELEILCDIDKICEENDIKYFLVGGTLLGAVRHKGFIPWDDDIDIAMLRSDYEKFKNLCIDTNVLGDKYFLHTKETDRDYYLPYMKVRKNNTTFDEDDLNGIKTHKGIFVDIFVYDNVKIENKKIIRIKGAIIRNMMETVFVKKGIRNYNDCHKPFIARMFSIFNCARIFKIQDKLSIKDNSTGYVINWTGASKILNSTLDFDTIMPLKKIEFEGKKFNCINKEDVYLTKMYGDYMTLPPKDQRVTHKPKLIDFSSGENRKNKRD